MRQVMLASSQKNFVFYAVIAPKRFRHYMMPFIINPQSFFAIEGFYIRDVLKIIFTIVQNSNSSFLRVSLK